MTRNRTNVTLRPNDEAQPHKVTETNNKHLLTYRLAFLFVLIHKY